MMDCAAAPGRCTKVLSVYNVVTRMWFIPASHAVAAGIGLARGRGGAAAARAPSDRVGGLFTPI